MKYKFVYDPRIELDTPRIYVPIEHWTEEELARFNEDAQSITSKIPAKILELDKRYINKYEELATNSHLFFDIMEELNELSGKISELNVLYRQLEGKFLFSSSHQ